MQVAILVEKPTLSLPVCLRNSIFYFHIRSNGFQGKRNLRTGDAILAKLGAVQLLGALDVHRLKISDFHLHDLLRKYEIVLASGKLKTDGPEDSGLTGTKIRCAFIP